VTGPARYATYVGRVLMVVGFLMIVQAWNGAASFDRIQSQFPYLLSGSMPGLGLVIVGAGLEFVQSQRQFTARRAKQMAELNHAVVRLNTIVREQGGLTGAAATQVKEPVSVGAGGPGMDALETATSAFAPGGGGDATQVVAGRSSFHDPSCHLVSGRDDMATISRLEAEAKDLSPCRVCKP